MPLSIPDCRVGTIVDWTYEWTEDGREKPRNPIKRGIITKVMGDTSTEGSVSEIWVKFRAGDDAVRIAGRELSRVLPASHKNAKEAYRRVVGAPKMVGAEFTPKAPARRKIEDSLALTPKLREGVVAPDRDAVEDMGFVDQEDTQ